MPTRSGPVKNTVVLAVSDANILYLLQRYAEESGFDTARASGEDLSTLLARQPDPALIILDVECLGAAGRKQLRSLRAEASTRQIPVVVYSSLDEPDGEWQEGAAGSLPRSVMYDDFVAALRRAGVGLEPAWHERARTRSAQPHGAAVDAGSGGQSA
jgi:CheY-like chemotaxis protein